MPTPLTLDLSDKERRRLEQARDYHDKPYVRERATALLKIADGWSGREVALRGLLKRRKPDTVYETGFIATKKMDSTALLSARDAGESRPFPPNMFPPNMTRPKRRGRHCFRCSGATRGRLPGRCAGVFRQSGSVASGCV